MQSVEGFYETHIWKSNRWFIWPEETRQDYIKQARAEAENSRVSIRNIRRDANQASKELQSSGEISEDDLRRIEDLIQKETDKYIGLVDSELKAKESDLLEI